MNLPKPVYDAVPYIYILIGIVLFALAFEAYLTGHELSVQILRFMGGLFLSSSGLYILKLRRANR
jgi:hypothetical protein